ncbi:hypothetical protein FOCC_FOCC015853 [Frankliniella occidentalis]|uniref:Uncharacterized protein LOC127751334 n=1 Tax=Frankliniella occidentalis TaxID=133901 RepID=A0A9C6X7I9_FRAOC|nr:uncharacterized protein LOC127751334 [Frankliniella occidentalis]KAE8738665.1 hypothetical protein FOCC_FOCC015853 [Frankliniella occidentalis]
MVIESLSYKYQDFKKKIQKEENLKIGFKDRLFMFLIRLRRGLPLEGLSLIAGLGVSWTGEICYAMTRLVFLTLKSLETKCFPSAAQQKLTKSVQMFPFKNLRVILDGVEFRIETPSNFQMQGNTYSQYKAGNTMRVIVGVDSNGGTVFVSPGCEGGLSEKEAVLRSGLLERLQKGDLVMTDRGFEITAELQAIGVHHVKPPSLGSRNSLTAEEEILTKAIAAVRIYSEHAMADIKDNRLLRGTIPLKLYPVLPDLVYIAAYLRNFSPKRIIDKSFRQNSNQKE